MADTLDVKNIEGTVTGSSQNGVTSVRTGKVGTIVQSIDSPGKSTHLIDDFDNGGETAVIKDRIDDPRYYSGDTSS